jgi:HK97 gp10 family phage protein
MSGVEFTDNSDKFIEEMRRRAEIALEAVGIHVEGEAKEELENSPRRIDTGLLRNSITHALSGEAPAISSYSGDKPSRYGKSQEIPHGSYSGTVPTDPDNAKAVYIGSNVQYAAYVHEGTSRMSPNRFLKNAVTRNEEQIRKYIERELKGQ